jgi:O-antigen/teichoic acid export membrane protein
VAATFVIGAFGSVPVALMARDLRFKGLTKLDWISTWVAAISSIVLAYGGFRFWSLVYSQVAALTVVTVVRLFVAGWWPTLTFSGSALRDLLSFGLGLHTKRLLDSAAQNLDNLVVGRTLGLGALGFYDKAFNMMNRAVTLLSSAGPAVSFRILAIISEDAQRFRVAYRKVLMTSTFVAYPVFAFLMAVAPELFLFMFGPAWNRAIGPFRVLCIAGALKFVNGYASTATQSRGYAWGEVWRQVVYIVLIVLGVVKGSEFGLPGASAGVLLATVAMAFLMQSFLTRTTSITWGDLLKAQLPALTCSLGLVGCLAGFRAAWPMTTSSGWSAALYLVASAVLSIIYGVAFVHLTRFAELRAVCRETASDVAPRLLWLLPKSRTDAAGSQEGQVE